MEELKSVAASPRTGFIWLLAAGMLAVGVLLLNVDSIGRFAIGAYESMRSPPAGRKQAAAVAPVRATPAVEPYVEPVKPAPTMSADTAIPPAPGPAVTAIPPQATTATPPAQPLARLYPAPVAAPGAVRALPAGRAGLVMLVRSGALRPASGNDLAKWKARYASNNPRQAGPRFDEWTRSMPVYEIVGDMTFPDGLGGANAAVFLLGERAPYPAGDPGHSVILDSASGSCIGVTCGMLLGE